MQDKWNDGWSDIVPTEIGTYLFFGVLSNYDKPPRPQMRFVKVWPISNGIVYVTDGNFIQYNDMGGLWKKVILHEPPDWKIKWEHNYLWCNTPNCKDYHRTWYEQIEGKHTTLCLTCWKKLSQVVDKYSEFPK